MSAAYLQCGLVVSAHPSPIFEAWPGFSEATVKSLSQKSVAERISKIEADSSINWKFLASISELYKSDEDFMPRNKERSN